MIRFAELWKVLQETHGWSRRKAGLAARYYLGVDSLDELRENAKAQPVCRGAFLPSLISVADVEEIIYYR